MKYQHAEALALALHSCLPTAVADGAVSNSAADVFDAVVQTVAAFVEAQPTLYGGKRFTEVAYFGKPASPPPVQANTGVNTPAPTGIPIVDEHGNLLCFTSCVNAPDVDPKAEAKAKRAERRAKRQADADAALLAAMVASTGQSALASA